jgi:hypothetical protein
MHPAAMVTAPDKLGLLVAFIGVAVLLWFGLSHFALLRRVSVDRVSATLKL